MPFAVSIPPLQKTLATTIDRLLVIEIFIEEPADGRFVCIFHGIGFVRVDLVIVTFEEVEEAGYQEELVPPAVLFAEQVAKEGVPLANTQCFAVLDSLIRLVSNVGGATCLEGQFATEFQQKG